jgi:[acyl-carrier-protein] S-malonyltransferase
VRFRAQAMQDAVPVGVGAMVAVLGLDGPMVRRCCEQAAADSGEVVSAANFNDPKQTVIAGSKAGVDMASQALKAAGAKRLMPLAVSAPFHSALMKPAADRLRQRLAETPVQVPRIAVVNNIDVTVETDPERIRDALYRQAFGPVRWVEVVQAMRARGLGHVFECGPGKVLSKIVARIDEQIVTDAMLDPASLQRVKEALQ